MVKMIPKQPTDDARRVATFLQRIAAAPLDHMRSVQIASRVGDFTLVTVEFIADAEFDAAPAVECGRRQDGTLMCRPRNGCDDCPLRELEIPVGAP